MNRDADLFRPVPEQKSKKGFLATLTERVLSVLVKKDVSSYPQPETKTSDLGVGDASSQPFQNAAWQVKNNRRAVYFDLKEMSENDPLVHTALNIHAHCATGYEDTDVDGFEWMLQVDNPEARLLLDELKKRLDLGQETWQIVRKFVCFGEEFREIVVDEDGIVRRFKSLPSYQMMPVLDQYGNKQPGWVQEPEVAYHSKRVQFAEWQIVPFVYGPQRGWQGTGLMMAARRTWKRLVMMEDGMALARMIRAYDKYKHRVPVASGATEKQWHDAILNYKNRITFRKGLDAQGKLFLQNQPFEVPTDFYIPEDGSKRGDIEILKSENIQLQNIDDVLYHQSILLANLSVPAKYLNLTRKSGALTDAGLSAEDMQFARVLRQEQAVLRGGLIRLAHTALAFQGIDGDAVGVGVNLPKVSPGDMLQEARIQYTLAQAADLFSQLLPGGIPPELLMDKYMQLDDDEKEVLAASVKEAEAEEEALRKKVEAGELLPNGMPVPPEPPAPGVNGNGNGGSNGNSTRRSAKGQFRNPPNGQGADARELARVLTKLQILVQNELEERGVRFNVGFEERLALTEQAIADRLLL